MYRDRTVLLISSSTHPGQVDEHGDQVGLEVLDLDDLGELSKFARGCSANHGCIILAQVPELTSQIS